MCPLPYPQMFFTRCSLFALTPTSVSSLYIWVVSNQGPYFCKQALSFFQHRPLVQPYHGVAIGLGFCNMFRTINMYVWKLSKSLLQRVPLPYFGDVVDNHGLLSLTSVAGWVVFVCSTLHWALSHQGDAIGLVFRHLFLLALIWECPLRDNCTLWADLAGEVMLSSGTIRLACRMLYGFARDRAVPQWRFCAYVDCDSGVPVHAGKPHSFVRSFVPSFLASFFRSLARSLIHSFLPSFLPMLAA